METKDIIRRYAEHYDAIKRIGSYPLFQQLQLSDLGNDREMKAVAQKCYNDMKKDGFELSVIDYLCLISTLFLLRDLPVKTDKDYVRYIIENYKNAKEETTNLLRLFNRKPEYLFGLLKTTNVELYKELAGFWFNLYIGTKSKS